MTLPPRHHILLHLPDSLLHLIDSFLSLQFFQSHLSLHFQSHLSHSSSSITSRSETKANLQTELTNKCQNAHCGRTLVQNWLKMTHPSTSLLMHFTPLQKNLGSQSALKMLLSDCAPYHCPLPSRWWSEHPPGSKIVENMRWSCLSVSSVSVLEAHLDWIRRLGSALPQQEVECRSLSTSGRTPNTRDAFR